METVVFGYENVWCIVIFGSGKGEGTVPKGDTW